MFGPIDLDAVDVLRIRVACSSAPEGPSLEVFLLDTHLPLGAGPFEESVYLKALEPVLHTHGPRPEPCVVRLTRTHRSESGTHGEAEISVGLSTAGGRAVDPATREAVLSAFRDVLRRVDLVNGHTPDHAEAIAEARLRVQEGFPDVDAASLLVTDEEHRASAGMWSVGLALPEVARFKVLLGCVDGVPGTTHITRRPTTEVVDSVGTG
jgi:hypothetical protein